jgi:hypothetical protein
MNKEMKKGLSDKDRRRLVFMLRELGKAYEKTDFFVDRIDDSELQSDVTEIFDDIHESLMRLEILKNGGNR